MYLKFFDGMRVGGYLVVCLRKCVCCFPPLLPASAEKEGKKTDFSPCWTKGTRVSSSNALSCCNSLQEEELASLNQLAVLKKKHRSSLLERSSFRAAVDPQPRAVPLEGGRCSRDYGIVRGEIRGGGLTSALLIGGKLMKSSERSIALKAVFLGRGTIQ